MKMQQHGHHLFQLTRLGAFNSFLVREEDGLTAVDTNMGGSAPGILAVAQRLGLPLRRVVLTHSHSDHVGSLDALHALLPGAEVLISAREARLLGGERALDLGERKPGARLRGGYVKCSTLPTCLLADGERVGSLRVMMTPGHTPGHLALLDERDGTLIAGDALQTQAGVAVSGDLRALFPFPALATWHAPSALASARALIGVAPARLAVGHGRVLEEPLPAMRRAVESFQRRLGATRVAGA